MAAAAFWMAAWWITEAVPLFLTALLPLILFPLTGVMKAAATAPLYINSTIFLFIGGFLIALTIEKWNLHKRIALFIIRLIGGGPRRIVLGFMVAAAGLSMWISNTATAIMMVPIGLAVIQRMEAQFGAEACRRFSISLMLGIAYGCSIGGIATLVGTPPNLSLSRIFTITFPDAPPIGFGTWMMMALPITAILLLCAWLLLTLVFFRASADLHIPDSIIKQEYSRLGAMRYEEKATLAVFLSTACLWVFRGDLRLGFATLPGWSRLMPYPEFIDDGTVALIMATLLFLLPSHTPRKSPKLADAGILNRLPWGIVLLFGGGFALAKGFQVSSLSDFIGMRFQSLGGLPPLLSILGICLVISFLTELTSNTATTEMVLPVIAAVALAIGINPLFLMVPATLSASCAFMMPVATPPNAIVFGSQRLRIADMSRVGVVLNVIGAVVITLVFYVLGRLVFGIDVSSLPAWAH